MTSARPLRVSSLAVAAIAGSFLLAPALGTLRAQDATIAAMWRASDIQVDGSTLDWPNLTRIGDGPAVAAQNDATTLYLVIASSDPTVRVQLATGLVLWLDGTARKRETFGLRLEGLAPRPLAGATTNRTANDLPQRVLNPMEQFDLLGPAKLQRRLIDSAAAVGMALASGVEDGTIVYELKVPLQKTDGTPHALDAKPGAAVSLGIETPADPRVPRRREGLADPMTTNPWLDPWGYGGYFTTPPPPPGGRQPREVEFKPLKRLWATVRLAAAP